MAENVQTGLAGLLHAEQVAQEAALRKAPNGITYAIFGDTGTDDADVDRIVQAVPTAVAAALERKVYYFVPLALSQGRDGESTLIAPASTPDLADQAICHRNVAFGATDGVFISTRLLGDRFALAFEFFINAGHAFVDAAGVSGDFSTAIWNQVLADVRGETSYDAWEARSQAISRDSAGKTAIDEKAKSSYLEAAFSDVIAIYLLSLALDFDYSELREREYPLLAPQPLAERLRLAAKLFPPNTGYEFAIRYRRRV